MAGRTRAAAHGLTRLVSATLALICMGTPFPAMATYALICKGLGDTPTVAASVNSDMSAMALQVRRGKVDLAQWGWKQTQNDKSGLRFTLKNAAGGELGSIDLRNSKADDASHVGTMLINKRKYWLKCDLG